ncbi:uncharacterized protein N7500_003078 [Penicillium coprophilum]|uniref:uncharacterized protein n=1 Tax=Penicillium coprophilum TaxID=36646 RepID=UPI00239A321E|nr:uncharacterized protein N7500_003078 [Penicillium coprophilum]KAJ5170295.1 hypothetical protein N7500_003078 [Penicillium coprophilum]
MPLNSQSKQDLSKKGQSKEHREVCTEDEVATLQLTVSDLDSDEPTQPLSPPSLEASEKTDHSKECREVYTQDEVATLKLTVSDLDSDEPTQPLSPTSLEASEKQSSDLDFSKLRLDSVKSQDPTARILLYPRIPELQVSSYGGTGGYDKWVDVEMGDSSEETESVKVLVVAPSAKQLGCTVTYEDVIFHLYFDPAQDRLILLNDCSHAIIGRRLDEDSVEVQPSQSAAFYTGCWAIYIEDRTVIEFELLPRTEWMIFARLATKRPAPTSSPPPSKRAKLRESTYRISEPSRSLQAVSAGNVLVNLAQGDTMYIGAGGKGYRLTRHEAIAEQPNSSVWQADHSDIPGKRIVVKVIKSISTNENHTIQALESWARESEIHSSLGSHSAILSMLGSDARFQSIYTEHIDAQSLVCFRQPGNDSFTGSTSDAQRILGDMASALDFLHSSKIVHNDIKPANILYSPARGGVLIDFGRSFTAGRPTATGGSPWYLAPEFMFNWRTRGPPSDLWALGVVMLWLLGRIPLPEKTTSWLIADIHTSSIGSRSHTNAMERMSRWVNQVKTARSKLNDEEESITWVVKGLLAPKFKERLNAETLHKLMTKKHSTECAK